MASKSEVGHHKNVENLSTIIAMYTVFGTRYNPSNQSLTIVSLRHLLADGRDLVKSVGDSEAPANNAINARADLFSPFKKFCTRLLAAIVTSGVSKRTKDDARGINRKIQGTGLAQNSKKAPALEAGEVVPEGTSTSQQSFDSVVKNFGRLIALIQNQPDYSPNETEFQVSTLLQMAAAFTQSNDAAKTAISAYSKSIADRDAFLYTPETGLVDIALLSKVYVKSIYSPTSAEFKKINKVPFENLVLISIA